MRVVGHGRLVSLLQGDVFKVIVFFALLPISLAASYRQVSMNRVRNNPHVFTGINTHFFQGDFMVKWKHSKNLQSPIGMVDYSEYLTVDVEKDPFRMFT